MRPFMLGWKRQKYSTGPDFFSTRLADFFGWIMTSHPPFTVAVWAKASLLIHSIVSPTLTWISTGEKTNLSIVTVMVSARAGAVAAPSASTTANGRASRAIRPPSLFELGLDMFGVLFMALENLQAGLEQILQFGIARRGDEKILQRPVHLLVVGNFV